MGARSEGFVKSIPVGEAYSLDPVKCEDVDADVGVCHVYEEILVKPNRWVEMACEEARRSVEVGGGPFGAVLLQIDDETGEAIRFWRDHNHVVEHSDPTAHAEISVIRSACHELGVHDLGVIRRAESNLPQEGETSHCEFYSSCEPCPMCYSAISWARIPVLVFSATRFEASQESVGFLDDEIYEELGKDYRSRKIRVYQALCPGTLDAFELWRKGDSARY